jgi:hypothetical protein
MTRSARPILILWLVALHVGLTLGATGLHALPGVGHGTGLSRLARNDHSHGPGKSSHQSADDCQVCQFLVQGQMAAGAPAAAPIWLIAQADPQADCVPALAATHRTSAPRAPPYRLSAPTPV